MKRLEPSLWLLATALATLGAGAAFWGPALRLLGGRWPVPLDDVFIHFGFARSAALGHPFEWIPGNGYSSGGTSLTYPLALAPGWLAGFRGERLAIFAAIVAVLSIVDLCRSVRVLLGDAPRWAAWIAPAIVLAVPLVDWSLFSGMEAALFAAVLGRALAALRGVERAAPTGRARAQIHAGIWAAICVATRPEAAPFALLLGVAAAHAAGSLGTLASLARGAGPTLALLGIQAAVNRALTGEWSAAGAVRKFVGTNPYIGPLDAAAEVVRNLAALRAQGIEGALGGAPAAWAAPLLGAAALMDRRSRRLAAALILGAIGAILVVSLNATARFQNYRYAVPSLLMLLVAACLGVGALARRRALVPVAALAALAAALGPSPAFPRQIRHFARASRNIAEQQVEVARRLAARPSPPRRVLVGDAGAIPYLGGVGAIDGLGLGGYRGMPFARASVHGPPAVVELVERLAPDERPDALALYPSWWAGVADVFGRRAFGVRIEDNVICGADEKVVYDADWSALAPPGERRPGAVDAIDVADLVDERDHRYAFPAPRGGWVVSAVLALPDGRARFDAGRIVPEGRHEDFMIRPGVPRGPAVLALRTDGGAEIAVRVEIERGGNGMSARDAVLPARAPDRWHEVRIPFDDTGGGDRVRVVAVRGAWRSYHAWLLRE